MILPPEEMIRVRLGKNLPADLTVRPYYYEVPNGRYTADESSGLSDYMPPLLCDQLEWHPDDSGSVTITGITRKLLDTILFESKKFGQQTRRLSRPWYCVTRGALPDKSPALLVSCQKI